MSQMEHNQTDRRELRVHRLQWRSGERSGQMPTWQEFVAWLGSVGGRDLVWGIVEWDCVGFDLRSTGEDVDPLLEYLERTGRPYPISYERFHRLSVDSEAVSDAQVLGLATGRKMPEVPWEEDMSAVDVYIDYHVSWYVRTTYGPIVDALPRFFTFEMYPDS